MRAWGDLPISLADVAAHSIIDELPSLQPTQWNLVLGCQPAKAVGDRGGAVQVLRDHACQIERELDRAVNLRLDVPEFLHVARRSPEDMIEDLPEVSG